MPMFWIEWNFILNRALHRAQVRQSILANESATKGANR